MEISLGGWPVSDDPSLPPLLKDLEGNSALKLARKGDDIEAIAKLVQLENEKFKRLNGWGYARSLNVAAKDGDMVVVDRLLRANADVITPGASRFDPSALEEAAGAGHFDIVKRLLEAESAITSVDGYYNLSAVEAAVESGQHKEVERLLKAKKMLDYAADNKCKALKVAAGVRDMRIGKLLVESGAAVNDTEIDGQRYSALTNAAGVGNLDMVEYLLQLGADLSGGKHSKFPKKSPLRAAAEGGHITMVNKLLEVGAAIDETKPLHGAARAGHVDIVRRLLDAGAPVDGDKKCVEQYHDTTPRMHQCELTALQEAARGGHLQIVDMLLEADADVNVLASDYGHTAVQAAAESGSIDVVKRLLVAGASVNEPAPRGRRTALQAAAFGGNLEMLNFLLDAGAQTETKVADYTVPAIVLASQEGHFAIFQKLLDHMNAQDANETVSIRVDALQKAAEKGHLEIVKALLEANTPAIQDKDKERYNPSPLETAVRRGNVEIVGLLIGAKADTDATRVPGRTETPLQIAVANGHIDLVDLLLSAGAQVNTYESKIPSALYTAAEKGTFEMVQILLDAGADVNAKTYEGETILQAAEKGGKENILKLLQARREEVAAEAAAVEAEWEIVSDVPINDDKSLCIACSKIPLDLFEPGMMFGRSRFDLHPSLIALQRSAQSGCPFCVFFWKRLGIKEITLPQPSVVPLYPGMGREGYMQTQITEPYPKDIEYPRQLITGFDFSVEPFERKRKPLPGDTSSLETFDQVSSWLQTCDSDHEMCRTASESNFLPPRLIDISLSDEQNVVKLINTSDLPPEEKVLYVTLSHNHGSSAMKSAITTQASLQSRYTSIVLNDLPLTFIHAIKVAKQLGMQYLWINQLCIIQDSEENQELSSINEIFMNSYLTIADSGSANDQEGLFRTLDVEKNDSVEFECTSSKTGETRKIRAMPCQQSWQRMYENSPLSKTARALHERELSPRVLHFTAFEVLWECRTVKSTEGWPTENAVFHNEWPNSAPRILDTLENLGESNAFDLWHEAVTKYTYRTGSSSGETYAILGKLARLFRKHIPGEYIAGVWEEDFLRSLAWGVSSTTTAGMRPAKRHDTYIAPSWSWASVDGPISFSAIKGQTSSSRERVPRIIDTHQKGSLSITSHNIELVGPNHYGPLSTGCLKVSTPVIRAILGYDGSWTNMGNNIHLKDVRDQKVLGEMFFDVHAERQTLKIVHCVFLFTTNSEHVKEDEKLCGLGLALVPVEDRDATYIRIGHIQGLRLQFFEDAEVQDITII